MLVTNGVITRNIGQNQLPEYESKGYKAVELPKEKKPKGGKKNDKEPDEQGGEGEKSGEA